MAPIRRYLRITKYSVLEVRIYLHRPSDASWLLSTRGPDPVLPRILAEVRPKVLPKLREENENARRKKGSGSKGKKSRGIKDVASQDDFEVSIFLKETPTRHSLLTKQKTFRDGAKPRVGSTGGRLAGWLNGGGVREDAIDLEDEGKARPAGLLREESEGNEVQMHDIPDVEEQSRNKRRRVEKADNGDGHEDQALFVSSSDEEFFQTQRPTTRRRKSGKGRGANVVEEQEDEMDAEREDDKKKMALDTTYDGFSIYGRILCLIVTRKGGPVRRLADGSGEGVQGHADVATSTGDVLLGGSQMMEQWVSTQAAQENGLLDDDDD